MVNKTDSHASRKPATGAALNQSAVTNGSTLHAKTEASYSRRFSDIVRKLSDKYGGHNKLDEEVRGVIRRIATMTVLAEKFEARVAAGEELTLDETQEYGMTSDRLRRAFQAIEERIAARPAPEPIDLSMYTDDQLHRFNVMAHEVMPKGPARITVTPRGPSPRPMNPSYKCDDPMAPLTKAKPMTILPPDAVPLEGFDEDPMPDELIHTIDRLFR